MTTDDELDAKHGPGSWKSRPFKARFQGRCPACKQTITAGSIVVTINGKTHHEECPA